MSNTVIFHNPRCSKSRQTLALLQENNHAAEVREYLKETPNKEEIAELVAALGISARELIRSKEKLIKELTVQVSELNDAEAIQLMAENPILIERPIVLHGGKAKIGRPPEQVLELFA